MFLLLLAYLIRYIVHSAGFVLVNDNVQNCVNGEIFPALVSVGVLIRKRLKVGPGKPVLSRAARSQHEVSPG